MTLLVHTYVYDADGTREFLEDPEYADTMAGFESTRGRLWGSEAIRALGARFFPRLDGGDLYVEPVEVDDFLAECEVVRAHVDHLAERSGYDADYITARFDNIVAAAVRAKAEGGGVIVW
ncbi:hypothetical protein ACFW9O_12995 [Streptomyces sp. NPDC059499]|uniref:hypothetical protein n=1 Tax=Streptomyces sp. NPDC059499 TaxID=3346852 RepID=UPI0036B2AED6